MKFEENQLPVLTEVLDATVWLQHFGVPRGNFERVIGRLAPACWVDVGVIRVHPLIIDVTPAVIMDLTEEQKYEILYIHTIQELEKHFKQYYTQDPNHYKLTTHTQSITLMR